MRRAWFPVLAVAYVSIAALGAQSRAAAPSVSQLLADVGSSVERYYARAQSIVCTEEVRMQTLDYDLGPDQTSARRLTYELRVAWESSVDGGDPVVSVQRELIKVNNRPPGPKDKPSCVDPTPVSPDTLEMLLPAKQGDYAFSIAGRRRLDGRQALLLDYKAKKAGPVAVRSREAMEDCWHVDLPGRMRGRVWIDSETNEVLRLDEHLIGMVDVTLPASAKRRLELLRVTFERLDSSTRYRPVTFSDPGETIMLPAAAESVSVIRNSGVPRLRTAQRFSNYRRFTTGGRVVQE